MNPCPVTYCVTLGKLLNHFELQFHYIYYHYTTTAANETTMPFYSISIFIAIPSLNIKKKKKRTMC